MESTETENSTSKAGSSSSPTHREPTPVNDRVSASSACVPCRNKHLKCDGLRVCTRCSTQGTACVYIKSRRGYRGPSVHGKQVGLINGKPPVDQADYLADQKGSPSDASVTFLDSNDLDTSSIASIPPDAEKVLSSSLDFPLATKDADSNELYSRLFRPNYHERCIEGFFQYFYDAHPFLPPRHQLLPLLKTNPMDHLRTAMCYVGSRYVPGSSPASYALKFDAYLAANSAAPKDASMVQAMLLFTLGLDGNNDQERAVEILNKAQSLAVELGMNQREYAVVNGRGSPTCEESLRRTWWELYVVSIMVAGFHGRGTFHLCDIVSNVPLPCEEGDFASGVTRAYQSNRK